MKIFNKIRFTKRNIKQLHHYPSSLSSSDVNVSGRGFLSKCLKYLWRFCFYSFFLIVVLAIFLFILLKVGISGNVLAQKMQTALQDKLNDTAQTKIVDAFLAFDEKYHITLEARNVAFSNIKGGVAIDKIGLLRLGLASTPLLQGQIKIAQLEIANSIIDMPVSNDTGFLHKLPLTQSGHIDFNALALILFKSLNGLNSKLTSQDMRLITIFNVDVNFGEKNNQKTVHIDKLALQYKNGIISVHGNLMVQNQYVILDAQIDALHDNMAQKFVFSVKNFPYSLGNADKLQRVLANGCPNNAYFHSQGVVNAILKGSLAADNGVELNLSISLANANTDIGQYNDIVTQGDINLAYQTHRGEIELLPSQFVLGSLKLPLTGHIKSLLSSDEQGIYDFNLLIDNGYVKPDDIALKGLDFTSKITGKIMSKRSFVDVTHLDLQTKQSKFEGHGDLKFGLQSPQIRFDLNAAEMLVDEVRQLWPINLSSQARKWIVSHISGGRIHNVSLKLNLPEGLIKIGQPPPLLSENELSIEGDFDNVTSLLIVDLPPLQNGVGRVQVKGTTTQVFIDHALAYIGNEKNSIEISDGYYVLPWQPNVVVYPDISARFKGKIADAVKLISLKPINAGDKIPFKANEVSGNVSGSLKIHFPLKAHLNKNLIDWSSELSFDEFSLSKPFEDNIRVTKTKGSATLDKKAIKVIADAVLNDIPAKVEFIRPIGNSDIAQSEKIQIQLTDEIRKKLMPSFDGIIAGTIPVEIGSSINGSRLIKADVSNAEIQLPWVGWTKGKGIAGEVQFSFKNSPDKNKNIKLRNFSLKGNSFNITGDINLQNNAVQSVNLSNLNLNRNDSLGMTILKDNNGYNIVVKGQKLDARALIKTLSNQQNQSVAKTSPNFNLVANIDRLTGFYGETLKNIKLKMVRKGSLSENVSFLALTDDNKTINANIARNNNMRDINVTTSNAGVLLRFMDLYDKVRGGVLQVTLNSGSDGTLKGPLRINNFEIVNEPRLVSLVSSTPQKGGKSLRQVVKKNIDVSVAVINRASAYINKGDSFFVLDNGILRGQTIGATFQGIVYDSRGNMSMTGTFMPAYGINRVFSDVPILGALLGNGRDRGLIGITFKIEGKARDPKVTINPISAIAPGVFRQIFEYQQ